MHAFLRLRASKICRRVPMAACITRPKYFPNLKEKIAISFIIMLYLRPLLKRWAFFSLTWGSWEISQFTQTFWGFEGSTVDPEQIAM